LNSFLSYVYWNVNPELFRLGPLAIRWYGLIFAILFALGVLIVRWQFRVEGKDETGLDKLLLYMVVGTIVGARLAKHPIHCLERDIALAGEQRAQVTRVVTGR
jgi:phosphatidylglycerol---prolipoprotein diacylglyceryl transferase